MHGRWVLTKHRIEILDLSGLKFWQGWNSGFGITISGLSTYDLCAIPIPAALDFIDHILLRMNRKGARTLCEKVQGC